MLPDELLFNIFDMKKITTKHICWDLYHLFKKNYYYDSVKFKKTINLHHEKFYINFYLSEHFIENIILKKCDYLDMQLINELKNFTWKKHKYIFKYQVLNTVFIEKLLNNKIYFTEKHWNYIFKYQVLNTVFIEKLLNNKIYFTEKHWNYISRYQPIDNDFIINFHDKINIYLLCCSNNINVDEVTIWKFKDKICYSSGWYVLFQKRQFSEDFLIKFANLDKKKYVFKDNWGSRFADIMIWNLISCEQKLSENFVWDKWAGAHFLPIQNLFCKKIPK